MAKDKTGQKSLRIEASTSALGVSRVLVLENYTRAKRELLRGTSEKAQENRKALYDFIFSMDPDAISPIETLTTEFHNKNLALDKKLEAAIARSKI